MRKKIRIALLATLPAVSLAVAVSWRGGAGEWTLVAWNDLGMHCMDSDYSVFSILPPFNTIHAQLIDPSGDLVTDPAAAGVTVTYEAVADPDGSINATSVGKTNFWQFAGPLYGAAVPPDVGITGSAMPGATNQPQAMDFEPALTWFTAEGVPITPYDDAAVKNYYPLLRLVARNAGGALLAETRPVVPVSDEMDCSTCHASGSVAAAQPAAGWVFDPDPERDFRLNVLLLHDELQTANPAYATALATAGYSAAGLYDNVVTEGEPILCAACHGSNALPGTGQPGLPPLTTAVHSLHADVIDPTNGMPLDDSANRSACYRCHPGSETRCLRGAMGKAVAGDGSLAMQCQACHGTMSAVGDPDRQGWLEQPACQSCHTGTAADNNGQIRYASVFEPSGQVRNAVNDTFATNSGVPAPGLDLYRFSFGHGGLACEACHGSTHAVYPASHANDNVQSALLQGHLGTLVECTACHAANPNTVHGGPHGLHPIGQVWVGDHEDAASPACRDCHGTDYRGTVLSYSQADWTAQTPWGQKHFWKGFRISCWSCHDGPTSDHPTSNRPAQVNDGAATTTPGEPVAVTLVASDPDGDPLTLRIVSQSGHGTVALAGTTATYFPDPGFSGSDAFTFAAWDGSTDSNLGTVTLGVGAELFSDGFESGDTSAWSAATP